MYELDYTIRGIGATVTGGSATDNYRLASLMQTSTDLGKLVLRVILGILILFHGVSKLVHGPGVVTGALANVGLPGILAYTVYLGEVAGPILLIIGLWTRAGALLVVANMLVAVGLVHSAQILTWPAHGGYALELQAMYLFAAVAVALLGAGRYSVGGAGGRWN